MNIIRLKSYMKRTISRESMLSHSKAFDVHTIEHIQGKDQNNFKHDHSQRRILIELC